MDFFNRYWEPLAAVPQRVFALSALAIVLSLNLASVTVFGEREICLR